MKVSKAISTGTSPVFGPIHKGTGRRVIATKRVRSESRRTGSFSSNVLHHGALPTAKVYKCVDTIYKSLEHMRAALFG